jgi:hypothetical protein
VSTNGQMTEQQRKRLTRLLFGLLGVLILFGAFGPAFVSGRNERASFELQCQTAKSTQVLLKGESQIAHDLGLPVATEIDAALAEYVTEVPPECAV